MFKKITFEPTFIPWNGLSQAEELVRGACEESELISALKNAGLATDQERLDEYADRFLEHIEHIQEVRLAYWPLVM